MISNFAGVQNRGIDAFGDVRLRLLDTVLRNNYTGLHVADNAEAAVARGSFVGNTNYSLVVVNNVGGLASANVSDSLFSGPGVAVYAHGLHASGAARIFVTRSTIAGSSVALAAESNPGIAQVTVGLSAIVGNGYAYYQSGLSSGVFSSGNNTFAGNSTSSGTLTYLAPQ